MTLKTQLLLLGLLTLALPWLAVDYIQRLDSTLRQTRLAGVEELAASAAREISKESALVARLAQRAEAGSALFVDDLPQGSLLDGYLSDWHSEAQSTLGLAQRFSLENGWQPFVGAPQRVTAAIRFAFSYSERRSERRQAMWAGVIVSGVKPRFYSPQRDDFDALILRFENNEALRLTSAASGAAIVERWHINKWERSFDSRAYWQAAEGDATSPASVTIEWSLPLRLRYLKFTAQWLSAELGYSLFLNRDNKPMHFAYHEPHFLALAERLATQEQRAAIYDLRGFPVAQSGRLSLGQGLPDFDARNSWLMRLYYLLASRPSLPYQSPAIPLGETHSQWFFNRVSPVARAVVPIRDPKSSAPLGHLVLDKQDVGFDVLLAGIYGQFVFICVVFAIFTVLMLLGFASLHSWRIRKLAQHAEKAIDPTGNLRANFIASRVPDEIGQLSRSFEILLKRLVGHQDYLKNLASKLSHELRTPLAIAQSSLDNLKASRLDDQQLTYLARAHDGVARLSQTLNAMSSVNALEQALKQTDKERFCLYAMLQSLTDAYTATYPQSVVMQWYSRPPVLPVTVEAAPELLVQMLDKLVENASQFSQAQHPITIATSVSEKEPKHITLVVSNRGAPLPASIEDQLFESMVSSRVGRPYDGEVHLGLGLYIARLICEHHGGSIRARSEPAEPGSSVAIVSFEMKLPIVIAPPLGPEAGNGKKSKMV